MTNTLPERINRSNYFSPPGKLTRVFGNIVSSSKWNTNAIIADFSHWDGDKLDPKQMVGFVDFAIFKASDGLWKDPTFASNIQKFTDAGIPCGAYHFFRSDPYIGQQLGAWFSSGTSDKQYKTFQDQLKFKKVYLTALDVEAHLMPNKDQYSELWISSPARWMMELMESELSRSLVWTNKREVTHVLYSAQWFINSYAKAMEVWTPRHYGWSAMYPYVSGIVRTSWQNFKATQLPPNTAKVSNMSCKALPFWQFTGDKFILPGCTSPVDLSFYMGLPHIDGGGVTRDSLYKWLGISGSVVPPTPEPEPQPEPEPEPEPTKKFFVCKASAVNIRLAPSTSAVDVGDLRQGQKVESAGNEIESEGIIWQPSTVYIAKRNTATGTVWLE